MPGPVTRTRKVQVIPKLLGISAAHVVPGDPINGFGPTYGTQTTVSEGHPYHTIRRGRFVEDIGGDFYTTRQYAQMGGKLWQRFTHSQNGTTYRYHGTITATPDGSQGNLSSYFPPTMESSNALLDKAGATAISRCSPTNSVADLANFLGELMKEGLPSIVGSSLWEKGTKSLLGKAAGEFLNVEFGWKPIVADVQKFATAVRTADAVLKQYERDAGRLVRRSYNFPVKQETTNTLIASNYKPSLYERSLPLINGLPTGDLYRLREFSQRQWFSGAFTYGLPTGDSSPRSMLEEYARRSDKLLGTSLTPELLWNLSPWSWVVDWFSNIGDVLENVSAATVHGQVLRYGYIMEHTVVRDTYTFWQTSNPFGIKVSPQSVTFVTETKKRRRATPFGFGLTWEGFSPYQMAILAAVGITRR